jgi:hypothetical protein
MLYLKIGFWEDLRIADIASLVDQQPADIFMFHINIESRAIISFSVQKEN